MRAPFQVLVFPFFKEGDKYLYAIFKRTDLNIWQAIAGGGEDNEDPITAAKREANEEAQINQESNFIRLSSMTTIPAKNIRGLQWNEIVMIPEIAFGVELSDKNLNMSHEHTQYSWLEFSEALEKLKYDSNKSALWELNYRLENGLEGINENIQIIKKYIS